MDSAAKYGLATTIILAIIGGSYSVGLSSSNDTVKQLEKTVASYEKSDLLTTEDFITTAIFTIEELKLSAQERKSFNSDKQRIIILNENIDKLQSIIEGLNKALLTIQEEVGSIKANNIKVIEKLISEHNLNLSDKDSVIDNLNSRLNFYESSKLEFSLEKGEGINLKGGLIQVGFSNSNGYDNICDINVNNKKLKMSSGEFVAINDCKVILTQCVYGYSKPAKFELICSKSVI